MENKIKTEEEVLRKHWNNESVLSYGKEISDEEWDNNDPERRKVIDVTVSAMEEYAQQYKSRCEELEAQRKDWAQKILKARDAFVEKDYDDVWHFLYQIASPNYDKTNPWEDLENIALPPPEKTE